MLGIRYAGRELNTGIFPTGNPKFQRRQHVVSNSVRRLMIAIVKQDDISGADFLQPALHGRSRLRPPVAPVDGPGYGLKQSGFPCRSDKLRASEPERRPDGGGPFAGCTQHCVITPVQFVNDALAAEKYQAGVSVGVIPDHVVPRRYLRGQCRVRLSVFA
jgi:hypothetical protein